MEEESIVYSNNVTKNIFGHASNTQRENVNSIFTSDKLEKSDELVDAVKNLTINDAGYYKSNTATTSGAQDNLTYNLNTVNHTSNGNFKQ